MTSALLEEFLRNPPRKTFVFVGFAGEEHGQLGSRRLAGRLGELEVDLEAMINLECLGVGELRSWSNASDDDLEMIFAATGEAVQQQVHKQALFGFASDGASFRRAGIPSMTIHSLDGPGLLLINTRDDDGRFLSEVRYRESYEVLAAFLRRLDRFAGPVRLADRDAQLRPVPDPVASGALRPEDASAFFIPGVRLAGVGPHSAEHRAGLRPGDIITEFAGTEIRRPEELRPLYRTLYRGQRVKVSFVRPEAGRDGEVVHAWRTTTLSY